MSKSDLEMTILTLECLHAIVDVATDQNKIYKMINDFISTKIVDEMFVLMQQIQSNSQMYSLISDSLLKMFGRLSFGDD